MTVFGWDLKGAIPPPHATLIKAKFSPRECGIPGKRERYLDLNTCDRKSQAFQKLTSISRMLLVVVVSARPSKCDNVFEQKRERSAVCMWVEKGD